MAEKKQSWMNKILSKLGNSVKFDDISKKFEDALLRPVKRLEIRMEKIGAKFQKKMLRIFIDSMIFIASLVLGIIGLIMIVGKYFEIEYVFLIFSVLGLGYFVLRNLND